MSSARSYGSVPSSFNGEFDPHSANENRRRSSLLDYGGENSINQLIKSISRNIDIPIESTTTSTSAILEDDESSSTLEAELVSLTDVLAFEDKSTVFQTVFNSINILIGIGLLSLPLAFKLSGLILGTITLVCCGLVTQYTASLLAKCYWQDSRYKNYTELGRKLIGDRYHFIIVILFNIDLIGAIIALIILFSDSFNTIFGVEKFYFKILIGTMLFALNFLSLKMLSVLSLVGIASTNVIILITLTCGFLKREGPGSLLDPILTSETLYPTTLKNFFISISIMMSNFGGHAVLPEFINDMKQPLDAVKSFKITFAFTVIVDMTIGVTAFLMFGNDIQDEFTQNLMLAQGYPDWCFLVITLSLGLLPISKLPLISRPIMNYLETVLHVKPDQHVHKIGIKLFLSVLFVTLSLFITEFGRTMAFLGAFICFTICITLPLLFYLDVYKDQLTKLHKLTLVIAILISMVFTVAGTTASVMN